MPYQHLWRKKRRFLLRTPNDCWAGAGGVPPCPRGAPGPDPPPARRDRRSPRPGPWREPSAGPRGAHCSLRGDFTLGLLPRFPPSISFSPRLKELLERSGKRSRISPERTRTKQNKSRTTKHVPNRVKPPSTGESGPAAEAALRFQPRASSGSPAEHPGPEEPRGEGSGRRLGWSPGSARRGSLFPSPPPPGAELASRTPQCPVAAGPFGKPRSERGCAQRSRSR